MLKFDDLPQGWHYKLLTELFGIIFENFPKFLSLPNFFKINIFSDIVAGIEISSPEKIFRISVILKKRLVTRKILTQWITVVSVFVLILEDC